MNASTLVVGPDLSALLTTVHPREIENLIESMKRQEESLLISTPKDQLTDLQARVKLISEIGIALAQVREVLLQKEKA